MLEIYAVNVCVETKDGDFYKEVAINTSPIIVFGREHDLKQILGGEQVQQWMLQNFRTKDMFNKAHYYICHCTRDNTSIKSKIKCSELTQWPA